MAHTSTKSTATSSPMHRSGWKTNGSTVLPRAALLSTAIIIVCVIIWFNHKIDLLMEKISAIHPSSTQPQDRPLTSISSSDNSNGTCAYPFIYNKPHKTGSSYISSTIRRWSGTVGRNQYRCSGFDHLTAIRIQECLPAQPESCAILNCHIQLVPQLRTIIETKMPNFRLVTSTRYAPHRILSFYMQRRHHTTPNASMLPDLKHFLLHEFNPYSIIAYHTEEPMQYRSCPMSIGDEENIISAVSKYSVVIDLALREESNVILEKAGLFSLESSIQPKNRGSSTFPLDSELTQVLYNVSCFERAMHHALLLRMASLYEAASNTECIKHGRVHLTSSCLHDRQKTFLGDTWIF